MRLWLKLGIPLLALAALGVSVLAAPLLLRPDAPEEWRRVRLGMRRAEVLRLVTDTVADMRALKGFEVTRRHYSVCGCDRCNWVMTIEYDGPEAAPNPRVREVDVFYIDPRCGLYNSKRLTTRDGTWPP